MLTLSRKIREVEESQVLALTARAKRMKDAGLDVVSLTAGEPDFPTPRHVKEAAIKAIEADFTHYTANQGIAELIGAIVKKFSSENDLHFDPNQILVSSGAKQSIFNALQAICNKGDEDLVRILGCESQVEILQMDGMNYLLRSTASFDVIFADPPYKFQQTMEIPGLVFRQKLLKLHGYLLIEHASDLRFETTTLYQVALEKKFGRTIVTFFHPNITEA